MLSPPPPVRVQVCYAPASTTLPVPSFPPSLPPTWTLQSKCLDLPLRLSLQLRLPLWRQITRDPLIGNRRIRRTAARARMYASLDPFLTHCQQARPYAFTQTSRAMTHTALLRVG